ncbi:UNVERIFIED_CONTAM: hypothetical protein RMT77_000101 [Armadillidium vulgare]
MSLGDEMPSGCENNSNNSLVYPSGSVERETVTKRSFRCPYCPYESRNCSGAVRRHIKYKHTGEKPFSCSICQMNFTEKCKLNQHTRTHTGEKPFQCDICLKGFGQSTQLKVHMYNHHEGK